MDWLTPELLSSGTVLLATLAAVLAWAAKLWWGKEYASAKDEIIKAKDAQIAVLERELKTLAEMTPMKIREYFVSVKEQLEEYNDSLQKQLKGAINDLEQADTQIKQLTAQGAAAAGELERLQIEKDELLAVVTSLKTQQQNIQNQQEDLEIREHKLSARQKSIYRYIQQFIRDNGYAPAIRNIQTDLNISSTSIVAYNLKKLEAMGLLVRDAKFARGLKITTESDSSPRRVSVVGTISAGSPIPTPRPGDADEFVDVLASLIPEHLQDVHALRVQGNWMDDALISDGDLILIDYTHEIENGQLAAVRVIDRNEVTLRRIYLEGNKIRLQPANPTMEAWDEDASNVEIEGRVVGVVRSML